MLYLTLVRSQLCCGSQVWAPQSVTMIKCTERIQRRASKYILGLPFRTDTSYKQTLLLLKNALPLCYWHEFLDMVLYFKLIHGIMNIDIQLLPSPNSNGRETRSSDPNHQTFTTKQCKTTTYQKSFEQINKVWNVLPKALRSNNISLNM